MLCSVKPEGPFVGVLVLLVCVGVCWCVLVYGWVSWEGFETEATKFFSGYGSKRIFLLYFFFFIKPKRKKKEKKKREKKKEETKRGNKKRKKKEKEEKRKRKRKKKKKKKKRGFSYLFLLIYVFLRSSFFLRRENKIKNYRKQGRQAGRHWLAGNW